MVNLILVEDDQDDIYFFNQACKKVSEPINLITFRDGQDVCDYLATHQDTRNTIVLLDLNMPRIGGLEALNIIRKKIGNLTLPVIIYTTSKNVKDIESCYRGGANSYIKKLSSIKELTKFVTSLIEYWPVYNRTL